MKDFKSKVVVITGAGSGIGRALSIEFAKLGAKLALNDYNEEGLKCTVRLLNKHTQVYYEVFDVSDKVAMYAFAKEVFKHYNRVDVVINNAGVAIASWMADEVSTKDYEWIMNINVWGVVYGSLAFLPYLRMQYEASLVNVSSLFGLVGVPRQTPYCMTKFAVRGFSESMYIEEKMNNTGVTVSCVHPGGTKSRLSKAARGAVHDALTINRFEQVLSGSPKSAAEEIIAGIQKKKSRIVVGKDAHLIKNIHHWARPVMMGILTEVGKHL